MFPAVPDIWVCKVCKVFLLMAKLCSPARIALIRVKHSMN